MFSITFFCHHHHRSCWRDFINAQLWIPSLSPPSSNPYVSLRCCFTFYLSPRRLISPQTAQFLEDHFVKSLGVNFATSMAVKSDWKIPREEIDNEALQLRNLTKHWFIFLQRHSDFQKKHCQRHNGPEGWVHITSSQILIKLQFQNLDEALTSETQPNISIYTEFKLKILTKPT